MPTVRRSYGDESGIHAGARVCVVAGLCATPDRWKSFEKDWRLALQKKRVPYFHSKQFFQRKNTSKSSKSPYKGWTDENADEFVTSLLEVIAQPRIWLVGVIIDVEAFMALSYGERCWLTGGTIDPKRRRWLTYGAPSIPYHLGFNGLITMAHVISRDDSKLHFVFEEQREYGPYAYEAYQRFKREAQSDRLRSCVFRTREEEIALQAADLVAHEIYNANTRSRHTLNKEHRKILEALERKGGRVESCGAGYFADLLGRIHPPDALKWLQDTPDPSATE